MNPKISVSCTISSSDATVPLGLEIWLDDQQIFNDNTITNSVNFYHDLCDDEAEHTLCFVMKNKTAEHTQIDSLGNIVKDHWLEITDLAFSDIQLGNTFTELATYNHDYNGTGKQIQDKFYGSMGCNGTVCLKFDTPIYLWLLEHM